MPVPTNLLRGPIVFLSKASLNAQWLAGILCLFSLATATSARAQDVVLRSPDGAIRVTIQMPTPGTGERPRWSAEFNGKPLLSGCTLGLQSLDAGELISGVRVARTQQRSVDERVPVLFGKAAEAHDFFNEIRYTLEGARHRPLDVIFRCYNDAIAVRYEIPDDGRSSPITISDETTSFGVVGNPRAFVQYLENFKTSHEHNVTRTSYREISTDKLLDLPLTFEWDDHTTLAITEAALRHYAGMSLMRPASAGTNLNLVCQLTPRADGNKVVRALPLVTPWRVALIGTRPGALLESHTIYCLNEPSVIGDTSWIKPGKITFPWWNGDVYNGQPGLPILSVEMAKKYIDFCARNGLPIHSMTSTEKTVTPWYQQSKPGTEPGPDTDVTRPRPGFELATIHQYAQSKGVRLWTWVHQAALRGRVEEAYTAFEKLGWSGMMVDFFDHDDQESVEFAESVLEAAARHHILIHLHGIWKATGVQRTYPNLMNHEGALNLEYLKWSDRCTPEHNLLMAFTRLIAGPMDYHLGGFRAVRRDQFKPQNVAPNVMGTRGHMLAMYVVFDNPTPMIADYPTAYEGQPGFDFLKLVPTWWDETRVLAGEPGELLVTARRKGTTWYVGALSAGRPRDVSVPLSFLSAGRYTGHAWRDAPDADQNPNRLTTEATSVQSTDSLPLHFASDGGCVVQLAPAKSAE